MQQRHGFAACCYRVTTLKEETLLGVLLVWALWGCAAVAPGLAFLPWGLGGPLVGHLRVTLAAQQEALELVHREQQWVLQQQLQVPLPRALVQMLLLVVACLTLCRV